MKKNSWLGVLIIAACFASGCASIYPMGSLYSDVKLPVQAAGDDTHFEKIGTSEAVSVLGLFAVGDASIETAVQNGGIQKIKFIDWSVTNFLGILGTYRTKVYGE